MPTNTLFPTMVPFPPGFAYYPDFIHEEEETGLYKQIQAIALHPFTFQGFEAKRKVESFGYDYSFDQQHILKGKPIPDPFKPLIWKVAGLLSRPPEDFEELLLTEYPPGSIINWHRDAPPFDVIVGISLLGDCTFRFRPYEKEKQTRKAIISIPLEKRSLYVNEGFARSHWQHSISPVKTTRYSITLRTLNRKSI